MKKIFVLSFFSLLVIKTCFFSYLSIQDAATVINTQKDLELLSKWSERKDNILIYGTVIKHEYYGIDQDWILEIQPDTDYVATLNNRKGEINNNKMIEAEIEPIDSIGCGENEEKFFGALVGKKVWLMGTWVDDNGHESKTELHPITGIVSIDKDTLEVFAFSDDSWNLFTEVPHSGESRIFDIQLPFANYQSISMLSEINKTQKRDIVFSKQTLSIHIETGNPKTNLGFYYSKWLLTN